jgi:hypothetical protein
MLDRDSLRDILTPSWYQLLVCLFVAVAMLAVASSRILAGFVDSTGLLSGPYTKQVVDANLSAFSHISAVNIIVIIAFWSVVYLVVYTLFWFITNVLVEARNELIVGTEFANQGNPIDRFKAPFIQLALGIILVLFLIISCLFGFPNWLSLMQNALLNFTQPASILFAVGGLVACVANLYALWSLAQIVFAVD